MRHSFLTPAFGLTAAILLAACNKPAEAPTDTAAPAEQAAVPTTGSEVPPPEMIPNTDTPATTDGSEAVITRFKANGVSPAWRAEVDGDSIKLDVPEHDRVDPGFTTVTAERVAHAKGVEYSGKDGDVAFTLTIDGKSRCDGSDENGKTDREFSATLTYGKNTYRGCADRN